MSDSLTKCNKCGISQSNQVFSVNYYKKTGKGYRSKVCNSCRGSSMAIDRERKKNRLISQLINWRFALVIAYGIFSHDIVDGRNRICIYKSVYGSHAMTISATYMCPISQEFEV